jgi:hypothetical protein
MLAGIALDVSLMHYTRMSGETDLMGNDGP